MKERQYKIGDIQFGWHIIYRIKKFDYYAQPWEKWANKLGGVN